MRKRRAKWSPPTHTEYGWEDEPIAVPDWDEVPRKWRPFATPRRRHRKLNDVRNDTKINREIAYWGRRKEHDRAFRLTMRKIFRRPMFPKLPAFKSLQRAPEGTETVRWGGDGTYWDVQIKP